MSNDQNTTKAASKAAAEKTVSSTSFELSLDEFCTRLSGGSVGPELIGGFYQSQKSAGKVHGTDASFISDLDAFIKQPA